MSSRIKVLCTVLVGFGVAAFAQEDRVRADYFARDAVRRDLWQKKQYDQAVVILEEMSRNPAWSNIPELRLSTLYNLACGYSLLGRKQEAVKKLREVAELGATDAQHVRTDIDLDNIRNEPGYAEALAIIERRAKFWDSPAFSKPWTQNLSEDDRIAGLSRFWMEVKYNFPFFDKVPDLDWDAAYLSAIHEVREAKDTFEYYAVLRRLCARLKDSHTFIVPPQPVMDRYQYRPALQSRLLEGKVIVTGVSDSLRSDGIEKGMEIIRVDGVPVIEYARREVMPYIGASSPQGLEDAAYNTWLLAGARGSSVKVEFRTAEGKTVERALSRTPSRSAVPPFEFEVLDGRVAYIKLNSFADRKVVTEFENTWDKLQETDFLILDLRANRGGNSGNGMAIQKYLLDKPFRDTVCRTRTYRAAWRSWGRNRDWEEDAVFITEPHPTKHYAKPILVLTSVQTGSASEDFLAGLDNAGRVTIVGEPTAGSTGNPLFITLPGGGRAGICTRNCRYPDGREFMGIGIQPHVAVRPTIDDIRNGRDPVLAAALAHIQSLRGKQ